MREIFDEEKHPARRKEDKEPKDSQDHKHITINIESLENLNINDCAQVIYNINNHTDSSAND